MSNSNEYSIADIQGHEPKFMVEGGILYCDGIKIEKWQLTPEELEKFFPEEYRDKYGAGDLPCPFPGCDGKILGFGDHKTSITGHFRQKHNDFWEPRRKRFSESEDLTSLIAFIKSEFNTE
jgi:hypothetical protein